MQICQLRDFERLPVDDLSVETPIHDCNSSFYFAAYIAVTFHERSKVNDSHASTEPNFHVPYQQLYTYFILAMCMLSPIFAVSNLKGLKASFTTLWLMPVISTLSAKLRSVIVSFVSTLALRTASSKIILNNRLERAYPYFSPWNVTKSTKISPATRTRGFHPSNVVRNRLTIF